MQTRLLNQLAPFLIATGIPLALMSCSSGDDDSSKGTGGTGMAVTGGTGASGGSGGSTGGTGTGGTGTGGSATGGTGTGGSTGGTGGSATGGTGTGGSGGAALGGMGGKAMAGGGGTGGKAMAGAGGSNGGASSGGAPGGGMGGRSAGGAPSGGANGAGAGGGAGTGGGGTFTLTSPDQPDGAQFGTDYTCAAMNGTFGSGVNPELDWSGVPAGTMSFAITFIDTKIGANMAMGQHWAAWNIPAAAMKMPKGTTMLTGDLMGGMQTNKYLAPCPSGNDTYEFTIYALPDTMNISGASGTAASNSAGVAKVLAALMNEHPLGTAVLHGKSGKNGGMYMGN